MKGQSLTDLFGGGPDAEARIRAGQKRLRGLAAQEGLPMSERTMTYNSRLAQEVGKWAESQGRGPEFNRAAFHAYFVDGKNIAEEDVLAGLAGSVGLDPAEAREVIEKRTFQKAIDRDWAESVAAGVTGIPTYTAGGRVVVGAQPYAVLETLVREAGAAPRDTEGDPTPEKQSGP